MCKSKELSIDLKDHITNWYKLGKSLEAILKQLQDQLYKQLFVSIKWMAQLCNCHYREQRQTIICCWEKTGQDGLESFKKNTKRQVSAN